jgi:hypothetical protein
MRSPTLLPIRMKAADTSASSAIADWTPLTVVSRSRTTAAIDTFISDVSTTSTNIAIASRMARRRLPDASSRTGARAGSVIGRAQEPRIRRFWAANSSSVSTPWDCSSPSCLSWASLASMSSAGGGAS